MRGGETVTLDVVLDIQTHAVPEDIPLDVLYEDARRLRASTSRPGWWCIRARAIRPARWSTRCCTATRRCDTLPRAGIVHRLDKDTSGVMVVARTLPAHTALVEQLSSRDVHRQYLAVVVGALVSGGTANAPIDRHPRDRIRMAVREDGRDAVTHYRLRERFRAHTLLECRLETGRTHQIRVHMAHLKHPIVGDPLYGGPLKLPQGRDRRN